MRLIAFVIIIPIAVGGALWWYFEVHRSAVYARQVLPLWQDMELVDTEPEFSDAVLENERDYQGALEVLERRRAHVERIREELEALKPARRTARAHENFVRLADDYLDAVNGAERKTKALAAAETLGRISRGGEAARGPSADGEDLLKSLEAHIPAFSQMAKELLSGKAGEFFGTVLPKVLPENFRASWQEAEPVLDAFLKILRSQNIELSPDGLQKALESALKGIAFDKIESFFKLVEPIIAEQHAGGILAGTSSLGADTAKGELAAHARDLGEAMQALAEQYPSQARSTEPALPVKGVARTDEGTAVDALVWAWSEKGRSRSLRANPDGTFELLLSSFDRWHIGAARTIDGFSYRSAEIVVTIDGEAPFLELTLIKLTSRPLPQPVRITALATEKVVAETADGARIEIPPLAALSSGTIAVEIKPTAEIPSSKYTRAVGIAYDIVLKTAAGEEIKTLREPVEIALPYRDEDLARAGAVEDAISPSFFDAEKRVWVRLRAFTTDKEKNIVTARITHLTRFALVAPADVQPPNPPSNARVVESAAGFTLSWTNPSYDFHHVKIYRSEVKGEIGRVVSDNLEGSPRIDAFEKKVGRTYYYLVRSVDLAGNESPNTAQIASRATKASVPEALLPTVSVPAMPKVAPVLSPAPRTAPADELEQQDGFRWHLKNIWRSLTAFLRYLF